ncbi:cytosine permease [Ruicaihuangia caeni]|uniref:Cytosine permease n=1 Tax=Ruicaihuangia caeni TaxID=3042517 RepID=A0AAW6T8L3_9MICO|nr:cytosine permease [Klugiella sp. YN-L-19]MDI2098118.1 cytosine permease [Klugiella sp. YN-L-19]
MTRQREFTDTSTMPLTRAEKKWGFLATFGNTTSAAIATWSFVAGATVAYYLGTVQGIITTMAGVLIGLFLVLLAALPVSQRYGLEAVRSLRPSFGVRGSVFGVILVFATLIGWNSVLAIVLMQSASATMQTMGVLPDGAAQFAQIAILVLAVALVFVIVSRGAGALRWAGPVITVAVILLGILMLVFLLTTFGWEAIVAAEPLAPFEQSHLNVMIIVELGVASGLSWWPYLGSITRYSRSVNSAIAPSLLGLGVIMSLVCGLGVMTMLMLPDSGGNPVFLLANTGGVWFGLGGLLFLFFANIGTMMVGTYTSVLALKQTPGIESRISWRGATVLTLVPVLIVSIFFGDAFLASYPTFLAFSGVLMAPICGIQIVDYFVIRKQSLDASGLYSTTRGGSYWYSGGFNIAGFAAMIVGMVVFFVVFDPIAYVPRDGFGFLGASIPSAIVSGVVYYLAFRGVRTRVPAR